MVNTTHQAKAAVLITVKNTFVTVTTNTAKAPTKRSSSVPCTFKPGDIIEMPEYDDLACASDKDGYEYDDTTVCASDKDVPDCCSDCTEDPDFVYSGAGCPSEVSDEYGKSSDEGKSYISLVDMVEEGAGASESRIGRSTLSLVDMMKDDSDHDSNSESGKGKFTLSLSDTVTEESRHKLRTSAPAFKSQRSPPSEVMALIRNAMAVLRCGADIQEVHVHDGGMGATTMIAAQSASNAPDNNFIFSLVKDAILKSAEQSENTYVLGYGLQPFQNLDTSSFSLSLACVPEAHQDTACWDTYENGICPRCKTCRWDHPSDNDVMRVIVMVSKQAAPTIFQ